MSSIHALFIFDRFEYTISYPRLTKLLLFTLGYLFPWCMFINNKLGVLMVLAAISFKSLV